MRKKSFATKILASFMLLTFVFAPIAESTFVNTSHEVSAKSYRSGKKSFNSNTGTNSNNSTMFNQKKSTTNNAQTTKPNSFNKGSFAKSMLLGGVAGLLFGSLLANMGMMGSVLGLLINVLVIVLIIGLIKKIFTRNNNNHNRPRKEVNGPWDR